MRLVVDVIVGKTYRHFSGNYYRVICIANDSTTKIDGENRQIVVYEALDNTHKVWTRPLNLFIEKVDKQKFPDAMQEYKFELVEG